MSSSKIPTSLKIPTETSPLRSRRWLAWLAAVSENDRLTAGRLPCAIVREARTELKAVVPPAVPPVKPLTMRIALSLLATDLLQFVGAAAW